MKNLDKIKSLMASLKNKGGDQSEVLKSLQELKGLMVDLILQLQLTQIQASIKTVHGDLAPSNKADPKTEEAPMPLKQALDSLEKIATNRKSANGKREFLLHRATKDLEYSRSVRENREYETSELTDWVPEYMVGEEIKDGPNPLVSCWIPEANVESLPDAHPNTGIWDGMGKNPFASQFIVRVKPGKYELHQEYKGA